MLVLMLESMRHPDKEKQIMEAFNQILDARTSFVIICIYFRGDEYFNSSREFHLNYFLLGVLQYVVNLLNSK